MHLLLAIVAATTIDRALPLDVTAIADLGAVEQLRHTEVLQVRRDFGRPNVNVALDAWTPHDDAGKIDGVRLWWSDEVDRYPFSTRMLRHLDIDYRRLGPHRWRVSVAGDGKRFAFDVALHDGRPAAFADVVLPGGRVVRRCRASSAELSARRILGIPVGVKRLVVTCTAPDGAQHRGAVRGSEHSRRRARRR
jgi:hypothetical protein